MNKYPKKVQKMLDEGRVITWEQYKQEEFTAQERMEIQEKTVEMIAAMELRKLRKKKKLTQEVLAKKMGVKREFVSRIETAKQNVTIATLNRIAEATGTEFKFEFK